MNYCQRWGVSTDKEAFFNVLSFKPGSAIGGPENGQTTNALPAPYKNSSFQSYTVLLCGPGNVKILLRIIIAFIRLDALYK